MKTVSVETYLKGVEEIYQEQPDYKLGCDGSNGKCDCIGMCRGALERNGVSTHGLRGTNDAARNTIENLHKISSVKELKLGQVVLKERPMDDPDYPLPAGYRKGGGKYNGDLTNYTHIGTVTRVNPLEITHMTSPKPKKDTKLGNWKYAGDLPYVEHSGGGGDSPMDEKATTFALSGSTVNMRAKESTSSALVERIPIGEEVTIKNHGETWCYVTWKGKKGYIMTQFLVFGEYVPGVPSEDVAPAEPDSEMVLVSKADLYAIMDKISYMVGGVG